MSEGAVFDVCGRYYDLLYCDKDYEGEARYVAELLQRFGVARGDILEFGSGTGRHGRLLAERGYRVHGVERSAEMAARATQANGFTCEVGNVLSIRKNRTYDAVVSLFHVFSYQTTNEETSAVMASAREHLDRGGLFVFDAWYSPAVLSRHPSVRVKRVADDEVEITRIAEPENLPNQNRVNVHFTVYVRDRKSGDTRVLEETHALRHFSLPEIDFLAAAAGFRRLAAEEFLTGRPPGEDTWGVCFVLQKAQP